ncbi:MAG: DUF2147 domain-containing protein [Hyphomicrobiaceae bacterium]
MQAIARAKQGIGICAGIAIAILCGNGAGAADQEEILGTWLTEGGESHIQLVKCDDAVCGDIVWIHEWDATDADGNPATDQNNSDPELRDRPLIGLRIFRDFRPSPGNGNTLKGKVYNPQDGKSYQSFLTPLVAGKLKVKGCILGGWICGSEYWTKIRVVRGAASESLR